MIHYDLEWDEAKARANERKHGVSFAEAATCFLDVFASAREALKKERSEYEKQAGSR